MKLVKELKTYCKHCKKHTPHTLKEFRTGKARTLAMGTRKHLRATKKGYGGKFKAIVLVKKKTKKPTFLATCKECKKKRYFVLRSRQKRVELVSK